MSRTRGSWAAVLGLMVVLAGCAAPPERPTTVRQALLGLGERAAETVLDAPAWTRPSDEIVLLVAPPEVDAGLDITPERFGESLTRALLARSRGPQILDWVPGETGAGGAGNQWLLACRLAAEGPRLRLSDRDLLPYRLTLELRRPGENEPRWRRQLSGAIDTTAL